MGIVYPEGADFVAVVDIVASKATQADSSAPRCAAVEMTMSPGGSEI
jgi:hypothetical protein